jgi:hypothetical protein
MGRMHVSRWKQNSGLGGFGADAASRAETARLPCSTPGHAVDADLPASPLATTRKRGSRRDIAGPVAVRAAQKRLD